MMLILFHYADSPPALRADKFYCFAMLTYVGSPSLEGGRYAAMLRYAD